MPSTTRAATAAVIGGSTAGLLAARVQTDHFTQVTIVERDGFPDARCAVAAAHWRGPALPHHR